MTSGLPFDDIRSLLGNMPGPDLATGESVRLVFERRRLSSALAPIADLAEWLARWSGRPPAVLRPLVAIFAGNHGVMRRGVSPRLPSATADAVEMCAAGAAAVNQVCVAQDLGLKVFDLALDLPTSDITTDAALDERGCAATMAFGMEAIVGGTDLVALSDLGAGGSTVAAAVLAALYGGKGSDWVGTGSGADAAMIERKAATVDDALELHRAHLKDPLEVLRRLGGREMAAIAGAILAARMERVPVILDGFATSAAAAVLHSIDPRALDHCRLACLSGEQAHLRVAGHLGMKPLLDFRLGDPGVGAGLASGIVKSAAMTVSGLAVPLR
ncbi:MAG: nicotinate-nucleotide--dimethylbenzimidazole phosphoribosyltransferase [Rhizobiaceae bacterium]|nr:nicotinate-nucleotide--dimethylbenzimidazole phosphoribosyltransferase [Rhizobiaceae bacterium]